MVFWENPLLSELNLIVKLNVDKLAKIVRNLEFDCQEKWRDKLKQDVNECCTIVLEEASCFVAIKNLREVYLGLCKSLCVAPLNYDEKELSLWDEKKLLEDHIEQSYAEILRRQNKLKELTLKLKMLAEPLQKTPITFPKDRVPTEADLKRLSLEVSKLEKEHEDVKNSFNDLQIKVKKILQELNIEIRPQFENIILISNLPVSICKANFSCLKKYYDELRHWQQNQEYKELESLKDVLNSLYNTCHIAQNERKISNNIHEHTLNSIQEEISNLSKYHEENINLFSLLTEYNQHWRKLLEFSRCFDWENDEILKTLRKLCREICNIEIQLIEATISYEEKNNKSFTSFGETIPDMIVQQQEKSRKVGVNNCENTLTNIKLLQCDIGSGNFEINLFEMFNEISDNCLQSILKRQQEARQNSERKNYTNPTVSQTSESAIIMEAGNHVFVNETVVKDSVTKNTSAPTLADPFES